MMGSSVVLVRAYSLLVESVPDSTSVSAPLCNMYTILTSCKHAICILYLLNPCKDNMMSKKQVQGFVIELFAWLNRLFVNKKQFVQSSIYHWQLLLCRRGITWEKRPSIVLPCLL